MNELRERLETEIAQHGSPWGVSQYWDINPGTLSRIEKGGDSPQVRRKWGIPKGNRCRLGLDVTPELRAEFHERRGDMSGGEYLAELLSGNAAKEST